MRFDLSLPFVASFVQCYPKPCLQRQSNARALQERCSGMVMWDRKTPKPDMQNNPEHSSSMAVLQLVL
jgi:hypothetical protein